MGGTMNVDGTSAAEEVTTTICCSHCGGACVLKVHVKDGVITRIETDDGETPQYRACARGRAYRQRVYAPDRLTFPLKRVGERGEGKFERISWDEALDRVAEEIERARDTYGPASILFLMSVGDGNNLHGGSLTSRLLSLAGGHSSTWGFWSFEQANFAELATFGTMFCRNEPSDLLNSKLIVLWGCNPAVTVHQTGTPWYLKQAREAGIKVICVDPKYTRSAAILADQWIPIRPGTDTAVLIAMAHVMITENLQDQRFLDTYTVGFDKFRDYVLGIQDGIPKTPIWAEAISSVPAATTEELAREYATKKPAAFVGGISPGRTAYGEQYHRAAITLAAMTGNIGIHGGEVGARTYPGGSYLPRTGITLPPAANPVEAMPPFAYHRLPRRSVNVGINTHQVADAILTGKAGGYPADYKLLYIVNSNYLNQDANVNRTARAFRAVDFIVTQEQFMTPTARFADIILPTATFLERNAVASSWSAPFYGFAGKVIEPVGECKSHLEIAAELALRLGVTDFNDQTEDDLLRASIAPLRDTRDDHGRAFPDYDTFKKEGVFKFRSAEPFVAFKKEIEDPGNNPFPTPSGRIEIYSQQVAELNDPRIPPIPMYIEAWESRSDPLAQTYPLQLLTTHHWRRAHSQFDSLSWLRELATQEVLISAIDAEARGISDKDLVRVFNDRGVVVIPARVSQRIMPGVVDVPQGAWYTPDENGVDWGGCSNVLTRDEPSPGGGFVSSCCLVQVEKA
jgi:anaerobic dimethyl sulfoxide reductase subunit A